MNGAIDYSTVEINLKICRKCVDEHSNYETCHIILNIREKCDRFSFSNIPHLSSQYDKIREYVYVSQLWVKCPDLRIALH